MPIETAPKDGTEILLLFTHDGAIQGSWFVGKRPNGTVYAQRWNVIALPSHGCGCCSSDDDNPTHWMPLPESPGADE